MVQHKVVKILIEGVVKFLRDSAGIAGYIDVCKIYRYYIKICFRSYIDVINNQF